MKNLPYDSIVVQGRQRYDSDIDFRRIGELATSIQDKGLLHPIVVRHDRETSSYILVAGRRRLLAMKELIDTDTPFSCNGEPIPPGAIPTLYLSRLPKDKIYEAELEENTQRIDLSWQERESALAILHELRTAQATELGTTHTFGDTAREFHKPDATHVRDSIKLAEHLHDPDIASAKTRTEALKKLKGKLMLELGAELSARHKKVASDRHTIIHGSFMTATADLFLTAPTCIVTDPPYGIGADTFGDQTSAATEHSYDDDPRTWVKLMSDLADLTYTLSANKAHIYVLCTIEKWSDLADIFYEAHWDCWPRPLIWFKGAQGLVPRPTLGPRYTYDAILFANKNSKAVTGVYSDCIADIPQIAKMRRAAEKPVRLYINLLRRSTSPGDTIWDPFCGTGPIFRAAVDLNLRAVGHDIDLKAVDMARGLIREDSDDK
jgi:ParB-like chromosome segregation protein Spo0J